MFRQGLRLVILNELACKDDDLSLEELVNLAIKIDHLLQHRVKRKYDENVRRSFTRSRSTTESLEAPEPMQCDSARLTPEERRHRLRDHLCLYCGKSGHQIKDCAVRPQTSKAPTLGKHVEYTPRANVPF